MKNHHINYKAIIERNAKYDGVFYFGLTTTGIFCKPSCPARCPKASNCVYFETTDEAMQLGYRACQRCKPLSSPDAIPEAMNDLLTEINANPAHRWSEKDLIKRSIDPSTARRQFKKHLGITFLAYARRQRLQLGLDHERRGHSTIDAQVLSGYESRSGFRTACARLRAKYKEEALLV